MDKKLEWTQCSDIYGDSIDSEKSPRCLTCGDTICKKCLQELIDISNGEFFECPLCKEKIKKEEDINNYIPNKAIISSVNDSLIKNRKWYKFEYKDSIAYICADYIKRL